MAKEKKPPKSIVVPAPIWLLSFGDTVALMLAFFVMLFAMSSVEESNVSRLITSITSDNPNDLLTRPVPNSNLSIENVKIYNGLSLDYIYQILDDKINSVDKLNTLTIENKSDSILISLPNTIFESKKGYVISKIGKEMIYEIGLILAPFSNIVQIEGHSPPQQTNEGQPFSNRWELRLLRSTAIAQEMRRSGLLASTKVLGWSLDAQENSARGEDDINLRITKLAGGQ